MSSKALQRHQERLERAVRTITGERIRIVSAASCGLSVSPDVAAFACGLTIVISRPIDDVILLNSVVTHEAAHVAVGPKIEADLQRLNPVVSTKWRSWAAHVGERWAGHEAPFVRALVHIAHRMAGMGFPSLPEWSLNHRAYNLSSLKRYRAALGDEPHKLSWVPLNEVLSRQAPESFSKLWANDVVRSICGSGSKGAK